MNDQQLDWTDPRMYLPILPVLVVLWRIYIRTAGKPSTTSTSTSTPSSLIKKQRHDLPNGMSVFSHQKGETEFLYKEVWEQREYAHKNFTCYDTPNPVIFDVGANIGMFSMFAAKECVPNVCTIHAFEPIPKIYDLCYENLKLHAPGATAHRMGLSDKKGKATFNFHPNFSLHSSGINDFEKRR